MLTLVRARVRNTNPGLGLRTRQQELEVAKDDTLNRGNFTEFENGQFGDSETFFDNDSFATAQFLGSINSRQTGNNTIQVNGRVQAFVDYDDVVDYYVHTARHEVRAFDAAVTDWERRRYFEQI